MWKQQFPSTTAYDFENEIFFYLKTPFNHYFLLTDFIYIILPKLDVFSFLYSPLFIFMFLTSYNLINLFWIIYCCSFNINIFNFFLLLLLLYCGRGGCPAVFCSLNMSIFLSFVVFVFALFLSRWLHCSLLLPQYKYF